MFSFPQNISKTFKIWNNFYISCFVTSTWHPVSSTAKSTLTTPSSTGTWFYRRKRPRTFQRHAYSARLSGAASGCSKAEDGSTTQFTGQKIVHACFFRHVMFGWHLTPRAGLAFLFVYSRPEPHILLFRRPLGTDPVTGKVDSDLEREAKDAYQQSLAASQRT